MMIGGLVPTFAVSRLLLRMTRLWDGGLNRLLVVHGASLAVVGLVAGIGMADGGAFAGAGALAIYAAPQAGWLVVDLIRHRGRMTA